MAVHQLLVNAAQGFSRGTALRHLGRSCDWRAFSGRVERRAAALRSAGAAGGDRVAVLAANVPEHLEALFAVWWAGLVLVPINTRLALTEQRYILEHAGCSRLLHDERNAARAQHLAQDMATLRTTSLESIDRWDEDTDALQGIAAWPFEPVGPRATAAIIYTGGTTGLPKGVELSHEALLLQALAAKDNFRLDESTVFIHTAPLFHVADFTAGLGVTAAGARHCFLPEFSPAALLDAIEREGVDVAILVPTMISATLDGAGERRGVMQRLRTILYGAAPIQEPVLRRLMNEAPGVGLIQVYGQTEVGGACTMLKERYHVLEGSDAGKLGSAGRAIPAFSVQIGDEAGRSLPVGQTGEILVSGPGIMTAYWNDPELSAKTIQNGWLRTGDLGVIDEDGFLSVVGRLKDMIITGGENVFAGEVESALMYHDALQAAAVIGVPDATWGEAVHAVVVLKPGRTVSEAELIEHCRARIARYKCPRSVTFRSGSLPMSSVGKIRKVDLLAEWTQSHPDTLTPRTP
jgi:acyl-CoA synthetase (AMP-forming)/AMP-acid ligase II